MELVKKYRPTRLEDVIGQDDTIKALQGKLDKNDVPQAIIFAGPSGCGKTSIARVLVSELGCNIDLDYFEYNAASTRGIDTAREIIEHYTYSPMAGKCRIWLVDEAHKLTTDAQTALLKPLEDPPSYPAHFILCTTDPAKIIKTIQSRCTLYTIRPVKNAELEDLLYSVSKKEKAKTYQSVIDKIVNYSEGSPRRALVMLDKLIDIKGEQEQLNSITNIDDDAQGIEVARGLFEYPPMGWPAMSKLLKKIREDKVQAETIRYIVLAYAANVLIGTNAKAHARAGFVISVFRDSFVTCDYAGLFQSCYDICTSKGK